MDVFHEIVPGFCSFIVNLTFLILTTSKETICYIRMGFLKTPPRIFSTAKGWSHLPPSFSFFCLLSAHFLIIVNQSAFIFEFRRPACAKATNLADIKGICKGSHADKFKKIKNEGGNARLNSILCRHALLFWKMKARYFIFMHLSWRDLLKHVMQLWKCPSSPMMRFPEEFTNMLLPVAFVNCGRLCVGEIDKKVTGIRYTLLKPFDSEPVTRVRLLKTSSFLNQSATT